MAKPPLLSGREVVAALRRAGFVVVGQRGSHIKLRHPGTEIVVIVPDHREVDRWTLRGILRAAGISVEAFLNLL